jgi:ribosomal protein L22
MEKVPKFLIKAGAGVMKRLLSNVVCILLVLLSVGTLAIGQNSTTAPRAAAGPASANSNAEREKIWNSPSMLRARAWVQEYCQRSAKISPEEAKQYMTELENLSPVQMKLWLLKFQHEEDTIHQQQADFERGRQASLAQAGMYRQQMQRAGANINRDETMAAETEEQSLQTQAAEASQRQEQKQQDLAISGARTDDALGGGYGAWGLGYGLGYSYGIGGYGAPPVHVHVHMPPAGK